MSAKRHLAQEATENSLLTFLPSGMAASSTSTLAMAKTSAEADMLTRNSA